jgi:anti-anti-sigma factor
MQTMNVVETNSPDADVLILTLSGRLDGTSAESFGQQLIERIEAGARYFVLDLAGLDYVSSVGLRALALGGKQLGPLGGRIVLCAPQSRVERVFQIAGFPSMFTTVATQEEGLACVKTPR